MLRAILFDYDGTLADTVPAITVAVNDALRRNGLPVHTEAEVRSYLNHGPRSLIRSALPEQLREDESLLESVLADFDACYRASHLLTTELYPGLYELLPRLHRTHAVAVLSNKQDEFTRGLAASTLPKGSWDDAQGGLYGHPPKPDPYLPSLLTARLGVAPSDCVLVGDSPVDVATAQLSGMLHVGVSWGYATEEALRLAGATRIAHTAAELEAILASLDADAS